MKSLLAPTLLLIAGAVHAETNLCWSENDTWQRCANQVVWSRATPGGYADFAGGAFVPFGSVPGTSAVYVCEADRPVGAGDGCPAPGMYTRERFVLKSTLTGVPPAPPPPPVSPAPPSQLQWTPPLTLRWVPPTTNEDGSAIAGPLSFVVENSADGALIGTTSQSTFTEPALPAGMHCRQVRAVVAGAPSVPSSPPACLTLVAPTPPPPPPAAVGSLVFTGLVNGTTDRLDIPINSGQSANVGATDFTIEMWLRPDGPARNNRPAIPRGADYTWWQGDIFLDRDSLAQTGGGKFGASLGAGRVAFGLLIGSQAHTIVGTTDIRDQQWHHVALVRDADTGVLEMFVDGVREAQANGPSGDCSFGSSSIRNDRLLVFGAEKHVQGDDLGYSGLISMIRISTSKIYSGTTYTVPTEPLTGGVARYLFNEGSGTTIGDSSGNSAGTIASGGVPARSAVNPF